MDRPINYGGSASSMSLRDYFAGQALVGVLSDAEGMTNLRRDDPGDLLTVIPQLAYGIADAMLAAREGGDA